MKLHQNLYFYIYYQLLILLKPITGDFNILIDSTEMKKMMGKRSLLAYERVLHEFFVGLDTELYYVKNGIVNNYAVGYVMTVNSTIEELDFTWQNLAQQAVIFS